MMTMTVVLPTTELCGILCTKFISSDDLSPLDLTIPLPVTCATENNFAKLVCSMTFDSNNDFVFLNYKVARHNIDFSTPSFH